MQQTWGAAADVYQYLVRRRVQLDKEFFPLKTKFPDFGPGEGVDSLIVLVHKHAGVSDGELQRDS